LLLLWSTSRAEQRRQGTATTRRRQVGTAAGRLLRCGGRTIFLAADISLVVETGGSGRKRPSDQYLAGLKRHCQGTLAERLSRLMNLGKAKKLRQGVRADRDPAAQRCQAQRIQRLRSTASQSSGRGSLEAPKFPVPHAALNLQGLFKGYRAVTAAVPPAGNSRSQPSAFLPRLSACEETRDDAATQGAVRLCFN